MSEPQRVEGDRVYCHVCDHEWDRALGGLQCPACDSEFVEIIDPNSRPRQESPPSVPPHPRSTQLSPSLDPLNDHNPWAPDPDEDDITTFEFNTGGGRGTFSFTSRTYTYGGGNMTTSRDMATAEIGRNFEAMLGNIMGFNQRRPPVLMGGFFQSPQPRTERSFGPGQGQGQPLDPFSMLFQTTGQRRDPNQPPSAFDLLGALLNPGNARRGDMVFSQEAFDRVMTQLMEQHNASGAPGPASDTSIAALEKKPVNEEMLGSDGRAECSICMDSVELGQEVTVLPCKHWFHGECVTSWLREHDTCPHCRKSIAPPQETSSQPQSSRRRRSSRRSSSVASPLSSAGDFSMPNNSSIPESPSSLREARQRYYGHPRSSDPTSDRPRSERRSSDRNQRAADNARESVTNWIRNRLPFSGQQ